MDENSLLPVETFVVDLGDCIIESFNPEVEDPTSEPRRIADELVSKKIRDTVLSRTGHHLGNRIFPTRVVRMPNEYVVIPKDPTLEVYKLKERS